MSERFVLPATYSSIEGRASRSGNIPTILRAQSLIHSLHCAAEPGKCRCPVPAGGNKPPRGQPYPPGGNVRNGNPWGQATLRRVERGLGVLAAGRSEHLHPDARLGIKPLGYLSARLTFRPRGIHHQGVVRPAGGGGGVPPHPDTVTTNGHPSLWLTVGTATVRDFHPQALAHAGRTEKGRGTYPRP